MMVGAEDLRGTFPDLLLLTVVAVLFLSIFVVMALHLFVYLTSA